MTKTTVTMSVSMMYLINQCIVVLNFHSMQKKVE